MNQTMKFGQLRENKVRNNSFKNHAEKETKKLVSNLFLIFKKALHDVKAIGQCLSFSIFRLSSTWTYNKNKLY